MSAIDLQAATWPRFSDPEKRKKKNLFLFSAGLFCAAPPPKLTGASDKGPPPIITMGLMGRKSAVPTRGASPTGPTPRVRRQKGLARQQREARQPPLLVEPKRRLLKRLARASAKAPADQSIDEAGLTHLREFITFARG